MASSRSDPRGLPEAVLVRAAQDRDRNAFAELVRRREGWLRALLARMCGDVSEADDLAQETFLRAWSRLGGLEHPQAFGGWLRKLAVRLLIDRRRLARLDIDEQADAEAVVAEVPAPDRAAGARIDLERALDLLSPAERVCITLNLGEGMSHGEIVRVADMPLGTVKSHIARGTAKLRAQLGEHDEQRGQDD